MSIIIEHPFPGAAVGADWAWHKANNYEGGNDYIVGAGQRFEAPADGVAQYIGNGQIILTLDDGRKIGCREITSSVITMKPVRVKRGDLLAYTGRRVYRNGKWIALWPHVDGITKGGTRVPFEPWVNTGSTPAGGDGTPITATEKDDDMKFLSHKTQTIWYLVGEFTTTRTRDIAVARDWKESHGASVTCTGDAIKALILVAENNAATSAAKTQAAVKSALTGTIVAPVIDYDEIARRVNAELQDEFDAAPGRTVDELRDRI